MKRKDLLVYINGEFYPESNAKISVLDRAFVYGDGVFEGIIVVEGNIFELDQHIDRLYRSAKMIRVNIPLTKQQMKEAIIEVVRRNELKNGYIRPLISRGEGPLGLERMAELKGPTIVIIPQIREMMYRDRGLTAKIVTIRRIPPECLDPRIKSCNYLSNVLAKIEQKDAGVEVGIMLDTHGYVAEACAENIFIVRDGMIYTPYPIHVLDGITRRAVMRLATEAGIRVIEANMTKYDLYTADEVFITGTLAGVAAITKVDNWTIGTGSIGPITKKLMQATKEAMKKEGVKVFD